MPDLLDRHALPGCPAVSRIPRVRVAHDALRAHAVQALQVVRHLLEYIKAARAVHFADVR